MARRLTKEELDMYEAFNRDFNYCWACGIPHGKRDYAIDFPRNLERAHIVGGCGRRVTERCVISMLCHLCHRLNHGDIIRVQGEPLPKLELRHLLWLKGRMDGRVDRKRLRELRGRELPIARKPPAWFVGQFQRWQGVNHDQLRKRN